MRPRNLVLAALGALAVACGSASSQVVPPSAEGRAANTITRVDPAPPGMALTQKGQAVVGQPAAVPQPPNPDTGLVGGVLGVRFQSERVLVLNANLDLRAPDPWSATDRIQSIALGLGGDVVAVSQVGRGDDRSANVTVRVPNERFSDALAQMKGLDGVEVVSAQVKGEDRTEQFIDLDARLKAKQLEEQRYLALLARAEKIDDVLKIDQVLSNVRAQIEQLTGQLNALKARSSMATISASVSTLSAPAPKPNPTGWQPSRTFQAALASLGYFLTGFADLLIWGVVWFGLPFFVLGGLFLLFTRTRPRAAKA